jgi:hypothetical protein
VPRVAPLQSNFNAGELSPLMAARSDIDKYKTGLETCLNFIPLVQGGLLHRPGTTFVNEVKDSSKSTRLVRFEFSTTQAYILEFGNLYIRVYKDHGQVESAPSTPVEIATSYVEADLFQLKFVQSADVLYIVHPNHAPAKLTRSSHTAWTLSTLTFTDGPYLPTNTTSVTMTPSATTGTGIVITSSGVSFSVSDIGRLIRIKHVVAGVTTWGWAKITNYVAPNQVNADVGGDFGATTASSDWRLSIWNVGGSTNQWPATVTFHEDRLVFGGLPNYPQRIDGSRSGDYTNMSPTEVDGTVSNDNAISFTLSSNDVQVVRWLESNERGLVSGTVSGEWLLRPSTAGEALTPTNITAKQSTAHGSEDIAALRAGRGIIFVQRAGKKVRELGFDWQIDGLKAADLTVLSEHITRGSTAATSGLKELAYQKEPHTLVWGVRNDGVLVGLTYERDQEVVGWHRHILGGAYSGGNAVVESIASIPAPDGKYDELWLIVKRTINGSTKRYIEYMTAFDDSTIAQKDSFFVDCGLTYNGAPATTISGLDHLEGQTVQVLADGATHPDKTVASGAITLDRSASVVQVGLYSNADGKLMRPDAGSANGTAQGKIRRIDTVGFRFLRTLMFQYGPDFDHMDDIDFRTSDDVAGAAVPLFTGDKTYLSWPGDYDTDGYICFRQPYPLPCTLLMVAPQFVTQD